MKIFEITSTQNDLVKYCVKLQDSKFRKKEKLILVDGAQTIDGFSQGGVIFKYLFIKKDNPIQNKANIENLIFVNDEILKIECGLIFAAYFNVWFSPINYNP